MRIVPEMGIVRDGIIRYGDCPGWGMSGWWEMSGMGNFLDGKCPGWEMSGIGNVQDGKCAEWEMSGMENVRESNAYVGRERAKYTCKNIFY